MWESVRESFRLLSRPERRALVILTSVRALTNVLDLAGLLAIGALATILASGLSQGDPVELLGFRLGAVEPDQIVGLVAIVAGFFVGKSLLSVILLRAQTRFLSGVEARLSSRVLRFIHGGSIARFQRQTDGEILFSVNLGTRIAISGLLVTSASIVIEAFYFVLVFALFIAVSPLLAIAVATYFGAIVVLLQAGIKGKISKIGEDIYRNSILAMNATQDLGVAFREVGVLGRREFFFSKFDGARSKVALQTNQQVFLLALPRYVVETALMVGVLGIVAWQVWRGDLVGSVGEIAIFLAGGVRMMAALLPLQNAFINLRVSAPQARSVHELIRESESPEAQGVLSTSLQESSLLQARDSDGYTVSLQNVAFRYPGSPTEAVSSVSLEIPSGSFAAIVGPSGAGKSTLADLLLGVHEPSTGVVRVNGVAPVDLRKQRPGSIAYVPQNPGLVAGTIAQNVAVGIDSEEIDESRVVDVLRLAQLTEFVASLENGIHSDLGPQSEKLSGGQKQRLGLARALYSAPQLIVLDEATSALDATTEASISDMLLTMGPSVTLVVIAHRLSTIQHADAVHVIEAGVLLASGRFPEVRRKVPMINEYVRLMGIREDQ